MEGNSVGSSTAIGAGGEDGVPFLPPIESPIKNQPSSSHKKEENHQFHVPSKKCHPNRGCALDSAVDATPIAMPTEGSQSATSSSDEWDESPPNALTTPTIKITHPGGGTKILHVTNKIVFLTTRGQEGGIEPADHDEYFDENEEDDSDSDSDSDDSYAAPNTLDIPDEETAKKFKYGVVCGVVRPRCRKLQANRSAAIHLREKTKPPKSASGNETLATAAANGNGTAATLATAANGNGTAATLATAANGNGTAANPAAFENKTTSTFATAENGNETTAIAVTAENENRTTNGKETTTTAVTAVNGNGTSVNGNGTSVNRNGTAVNGNGTATTLTTAASQNAAILVEKPEKSKPAKKSRGVATLAEAGVMPLKSKLGTEKTPESAEGDVSNKSTELHETFEASTCNEMYRLDRHTKDATILTASPPENPKYGYLPNCSAKKSEVAQMPTTENSKEDPAFGNVSSKILFFNQFSNSNVMEPKTSAIKRSTPTASEDRTSKSHPKRNCVLYHSTGKTATGLMPKAEEPDSSLDQISKPGCTQRRSCSVEMPRSAVRMHFSTLAEKTKYMSSLMSVTMKRKVAAGMLYVPTAERGANAGSRHPPPFSYNISRNFPSRSSEPSTVSGGAEVSPPRRGSRPLGSSKKTVQIQSNQV